MKDRPLTSKELEALRHIRNALVHGGEAPSIRKLQHFLGYSSPNAAAYVLLRLIEQGYLRRRPDGKIQVLRETPEDSTHARTVNVPIVGAVPCGAPLLAEENIDAMIPVSTRLARPPHRYFFLRAKGDSMDRAGIQDGDLVLIRLQPTAESGDLVVALVDDEATLKEFHRVGDAIVLEPRSRNMKHRPIVLTSDFQVQGVVVTTIREWKKG